MRYFYLLLVSIALLAGCNPKPTWSDEFNGSTFDTMVWNKIPMGTAPWNKNMALDDSLFSVEHGCLILRGVMTPDSMIHTAGLDSHGKKSFRYGRYEIRAKLPGAHGAWPALWMMPEDKLNHYGEIDICEKLNFDDSAYQTVHTELNLKGDPFQKKSAKGAINPDDFNIYGVELYKDSLRFFINDTYTLTYRRMAEGPNGEEISQDAQWPLDREWHLKVDMQIGAPWPGEACLEELPIQMEIDWIRYYEFKQ